MVDLVLPWQMFGKVSSTFEAIAKSWMTEEECQM
jgi:hypothetical protein